MTAPKPVSTPDLSAALAAAKLDIRTTMNCVNIGIIKEFFPANQTASIQIAFKQIISVDPAGVKTYKEVPAILNCPVVTLFGGNSFMSMPIQVGDNCLVLFNDKEIDNWLFNGGGNTVPVSTMRTHDITDAIAIVGIRPFTNSIEAYLPNGIRIQFSADSKIDFIENAINSLANLWTHTGNVHITGDITVDGVWHGNDGGQMLVDTDIIQTTGKVLKAGNGATGTFDTVVVANGIVVGGS